MSKPAATKLQSGRGALHPRLLLRAPVCLGLLFVLLGSGVLPAEEPPPEPPVHEIKMTAKKYEYNPEKIHVQEGERVRLLITALDRKHGFQIKALDINVELEQGKETVVEFVAPKAGEYKFNCSVRCGWRHPWMDGKLIVEPAAPED